jgi:hypothetical protein
VGFKSLSIIKYIEPMTGDLFTTSFANSIFNKDHFPALTGNCTRNLNVEKLIGMQNACPL